MKAYSIDLRQKVIDAYNNQEGSLRQLGKRFSVSLSFVKEFLRSIAARTYQDLDQAITDALTTVTPKDSIG